MPYLTTITLRILSEEPVPDDISPDEVWRETVCGDYSGDYKWETEVISDERCKELLTEQGSDTEFFYPADEDSP
jgi:hypothetical protein